MVSVPPFLPSAAWYAQWLRAFGSGASDKDAILAANASSGIGGKDFAHTLICRSQLLSMAVEGGSSILKRRGGAGRASLSDHGNWRHNHLGAFEAVYGRTPYYQHLIPLIRDIYLSEEHSLARFNLALHTALVRFASLDTVSLSGSPQSDSPALKRGRELAVGIDPGLSLLDAAMRLGPEIILPLAALPLLATN